MNEQVLLNERGVLVSTTRFVAPQATFALATVSSVRLGAETKGNKRVALIAFSLSMLISAYRYMDRSGAVVLACLLVAIVMAFLAARAVPVTWYYLFVTTNAGESPGLKDTDGEWIRRVHDALVHAIVSRG